MKVKNLLKKVRESRLMSKAELARASGISVLTIDRIERGACSHPKTKRLLLEALGIDLEDRENIFPLPPEQPDPKQDRTLLLAELPSVVRGSVQAGFDLVTIIALLRRDFSALTEEDIKAAYEQVIESNRVR